MDIQKISVNKLKSAKYNPRKDLKPGDIEFEKLKRSIEEFGYVEPVIWNMRTGTVVGGHQRLKVMKHLGFTEVDCVVLDIDENKEKALNVALNKISGDWDMPLLGDLMKDLSMNGFDITLTGFDMSEVDDFFGGNDKGEIEEDNFDVVGAVENIKVPISKQGDVWHIGRHQLLVGDSTKKEQVQAFMGDTKADLLITDPPYNVSYEGVAGTIKNDSMDDLLFRKFLVDAFTAASNVMKKGATFYIWHADSEGYNFRGACHDIDWKVRQCLIWNKSSLVMGRQDYQWKHEPCQPMDTMVLTPKGEVPIQDLKDNDRVVTYSSYSGEILGKREGVPIKVASRHYNGKLYGISVGDKITWATNNHKFSIRFRDNMRKCYCTYLMNKGDWWRVGVAETYSSRGFGVKQRLRQEKGERVWIIDTFDDRLDAQCAEQVLGVKYGIPQTVWETERGFRNRTYNSRNDEQIASIYSSLDLNLMRENADRLLCDYNRCMEFPLIDLHNMSHHMSCRVTTKVEACNIIPSIMDIPVPLPKWEGTKSFIWCSIDEVKTKKYEGMVYSLEVEKYGHYIADGIITHNCLYGWVPGASHYWGSDRKQTTVLDFDKPSRSVLHPTMKPIELFAYQIKNSSKCGDLVLDLFAGSGTTMMACEQLNRSARMVEFDEKYADVIVKRYIEKYGKNEVYLMRENDKILCDKLGI